MSVDWDLLEPHDTLAAWRQAVDASPSATFFHTPAWADLVCDAKPDWRPASVAIEFHDGVLAVLPMLRRADSLHCQSMAPYVYGGPLFTAEPTEGHLDEIGKVARWYSDIVLYGNPYSTFDWMQEGLVRWRIHTHVLDLSRGFSAVVDGSRKMIRRHCRSAERGGVVASVARESAQVDQYYDLYLESLLRWGDAAESYYPRELFHALFDLQERTGTVQLWIAELDRRVVSGATLRIHRDHITAWHYATGSHGLRVHASPLLHMTAIEAACAAGLRWYDFNPSGELLGAQQFKESFGAERRRFDMYASPAATQPPVDRPPADLLEGS